MIGEHVLIPTNEYQTPITQELLSKYPKEVQEQLLDFIATVPFIQNLISPSRPKIEDLPRDAKGRAIIDITNPPLYKDANYFRKTVLYFQEEGCYTKLKPNSNPNSEYRRFWAREINRIYNGMLRESDGMWISGYNYWLLNYVPMLVNKVVKGTKKAVRIKNWGSFWEGIWWRHLYLDASREAGEHSAELSKRGSSKSYSLASILSHNLILGETAEANEERVAILTAYQKEYLQDSKDGTLKKFVPILSHVMSNTPFPHLMLTNSSEKMTWQMGYTDSNGNKKGSLNMVMGVSSKDDSDKLRGKRGYILFEEFGNFPNLLELYDVTRRSVEEGDYAFSQMILVGTANNKEANFQSAKTLLYSPKGYRIHELNNVYDKKGQGRDKFTYFFPAYINRLGLYNEDGISDVTASLLEILMNRYRSKYGADPTSVLRVIAEDPITPAEAIIKVKDAFFPVQALTERAQQLDQNPHLYSDIYIGEIIINSSGEPTFKPNGDIPIRTYPVDNTTKGALEIYRMPEKDRTGKIFPERYILAADPYDNDQAESSSLYSIFVFDLFTDTIVAEYTGRTEYANDAHEIVRRLCLFYNGKALYEANKKGLYAYMESKHSTHLLADTPEYLRDKQLIKYTGFGSSKKGVTATAPINNYANRLIKDWLNKIVPMTNKDESGHEVQVEAPILYSLKNRALIEELIQFNPEMNFDRVRALGMAMLYREAYIIMYGNNLNAESREKVQSTYLGNDKFLKDNYLAHKNRMANKSQV